MGRVAVCAQQIRLSKCGRSFFSFSKNPFSACSMLFHPSKHRRFFNNLDRTLIFKTSGHFQIGLSARLFFQKAHEKQVRLTWRRLVEVHADRKIGTIYAASWAAQSLTSQIPLRQALQGPFVPFTPVAADLQYPTQHAWMTKFIAQQGIEDLCQDLEKCWAACYLQDGSVDIKQIDNELHIVR